MKFRVWDSRNKRDVTHEEDWFLTSKGDLCYFDGTNGIASRNYYVPEFSSGVTDKNGVEIYENDVVLMRSHMGGKCMASVCFIDGRFVVDNPYGTYIDLEPDKLEVIRRV